MSKARNGGTEEQGNNSEAMQAATAPAGLNMADEIARPVGNHRRLRELLEWTLNQVETADEGSEFYRPERRRGVHLNLFPALMTEVTKNTELFECTCLSWANAVRELMVVDLVPGASQEVYLFWRNARIGEPGNFQSVKEVAVEVGYRGLMKLAHRTGALSSIRAQVVYSGDEFKFEDGTETRVGHKRRQEADEKPTAVWSLIKLKSGDVLAEHLTWKQVEHIKSKSKNKKPDGPWAQWPEEMARKACVRRALKYVPMPDRVLAAAVDAALELDSQSYDVGEPEELQVGNPIMQLAPSSLALDTAPMSVEDLLAPPQQGARP